jgi:hypothetical protein
MRKGYWPLIAVINSRKLTDKLSIFQLLCDVLSINQDEDIKLENNDIYVTIRAFNPQMNASVDVNENDRNVFNNKRNGMDRLDDMYGSECSLTI